MRNALTLAAIFGLCSAGLYACSSSDTTPPKGDAGPQAEGGKPDAGKDSGPTVGTSCSNAIGVNLAEETPGAFVAAGQSIFYSIKVGAGDFLILSAGTEATADSGDTIVDTAISVFDATGQKLLAADDDAFPRFTTDAELYYRAPAAATLCVQVTDFDTWSGGTGKLAADPSFKFFAGVIDPKAAVVTFDAEPNDAIGTAQAGKLKDFATPPGAYTFVVGALKDATDQDVYKFTVPAGTTVMNVEVPPIGAPLNPNTSTYGSTMARFTATVKKADGTIVAEVAPPQGQTEKMSGSMTTPVAPGDYFLVISRPAGMAPGSNDFYATTLQFQKGSPPEAETTSGVNDTLATAEALALTTNKGNAKLKDGYILANLPAGDAADSFSFPVGTGDSVAIACSAGRDGSGLQSFKVELFVGGASKQVETEVATADVAWSTAKTASKPAVAITAAGTAVLQLSAGGLSATNTGSYYLCGVHVTSP